MESIVLLDVKGKEKILVKRSTLERYKVEPSRKEDSHQFALMSQEIYHRIREEALSIYKARMVTEHWHIEIEEQMKSPNRKI